MEGDGRCNACHVNTLRKQLGKKFLMIANTVYELDAEVAPGQGEPMEFEGRPIKFHVWVMANEHSGEGYGCPRATV